MYDRQKLDELRHSLEAWNNNDLKRALDSLPERQAIYHYPSEPVNGYL
jgi:hypothetical protein